MKSIKKVYFWKDSDKRKVQEAILADMDSDHSFIYKFRVRERSSVIIINGTVGVIGNIHLFDSPGALINEKLNTISQKIDRAKYSISYAKELVNIHSNDIVKFNRERDEYLAMLEDCKQ